MRGLLRSLVVLAPAAVALAASCGGDSDSGVASNSSGGSGGTAAGGSGGGDASAGTGGTSGVGGSISIGDAETCPQGQACGDGGICAGGACCEATQACGDECCDPSSVCSFGRCAVPGDVCADSQDCADGEYCDYALGDPQDSGAPPADSGVCIGGAAQVEGRCLPRPPRCPETDAGAPPPDAGSPMDCLEKCEFRPPTTSFTPVEKLNGGGEISPPTSTDVMMTPIVVQLDDDDCDGKITARDIPEIVFTTFASGGYTSTGTLRVISVVNGALVDKWTAPNIAASRQLAGGNVDGQPGNEVVGCDISGTTVHAFRGDGTSRWSSSAPITCCQPASADLDEDGVPEVIVEGGILDGATGNIEATFSPPMEGTFAVADVTGDGRLDIVSNSQVYDASGAQVAATGFSGHAWTGGTNFHSGPAVADLDLDGKPEVIAVYFNQHQLAIWRYDAGNPPGNTSFVRAGIDINGTLNPALCASGSAGSKWGGGPVTVGDFNGDSVPDVALAGGVGYAVFDGAKLMSSAVLDADTFMWVKQTVDCSSAGTGSSLFDFNGDGRAEVVYSDEFNFRIYEGATGNVLFETCNTSGTLNEYPVVADVDSDGEADVVIASNAYSSIQCPGGTKTSGIRIFGSANNDWVRTRRVWNQHAYQITNTAEDGTIPQNEPDNWTQTGLNNFRLNRQPGSEFAAPDAVVEVSIRCGASYGLIATVRNLGESVLPPGVLVEFFAGTPPGGTKLGDATTSIALGPAQAEQIVLDLGSAPPDVASGMSPVYATVGVSLPTRECREDNNTSPPVSGVCGGPF